VLFLLPGKRWFGVCVVGTLWIILGGGQILLESFHHRLRLQAQDLCDFTRLLLRVGKEAPLLLRPHEKLSDGQLEAYLKTTAAALRIQVVSFQVTPERIEMSFHVASDAKIWHYLNEVLSHTSYLQLKTCGIFRAAVEKPWVEGRLVWVKKQP
jgi:hypothetical protein